MTYFGIVLPALVAPAVAGAQDQATGAGYWASACARCHGSTAAVMRELPADEAAARALLDSFLATHRAPNPAARMMLVNWLLTQARE